MFKFKLGDGIVEEMLDILDENGILTGIKKERSAVHTDGDWHKVIQIFIVNENKILLQQRALTKKSDPGKWCASASGHISAGETSFTAAIKEFQEELGREVEKDKLKLVDTFKSPSIRTNNGKTIYNNHFVDLYISEQSIDLNKVCLQQEEVFQVRFYEISEFERMVKSEDERLTDTPILFEHLLSKLFLMGKNINDGEVR